MSVFDITSDVIVLVQWFMSGEWIFAVLSSISIVLTSWFSYVTAIAQGRGGCLKLGYFFHIGIWIELFDSLKQNRKLTSFKKLKFAEALYEALPQGTIQFFFILTS